MTAFIPTHAITKVTSLSRWQLAKQHRGKFSLTVKQGEWLTRYVSDEPSIAIAQAWLEKLTNDAPTVWCLIDHVEEDDVFFMHVCDGVVREARRLSLDKLNRLKLSLGQRIYLTPSMDEAHPHFEGLPITSVSPLEPHDWANHQLKSHQRFIWPILALVFMLLMTVAWSAYHAHQQTVSQEANKVVDVYQGYRHKMQRALSASDAIDQALTLATYSTFAPVGWSPDKVMLKGKDIIAVLKREETGLMASMEHWLAKRPHIVPSSVLTINHATLKRPITASMTQWTEQMAPYTLADKLVDKLTLLKWRITNSKESPSPLTTSLEVTIEKKDATLSELASLRVLFQPLPVSLNALSLSPNADSTYRATLHIEYTGETP